MQIHLSECLMLQTALYKSMKIMKNGTNLYQVNRKIILFIRLCRKPILLFCLIGVTEAGYKSKQCQCQNNVNVKTADKCLQFGVKQCKSMLIGKELETILHIALTVDKWAFSHEDIPQV